MTSVPASLRKYIAFRLEIVPKITNMQNPKWLHMHFNNTENARFKKLLLTSGIDDKFILILTHNKQ